MRVLIIHTSYQFKGGEDTVVAEEAQLLRDAGCDVEVLSFDNIKQSFLKLLQLPFNIGSYKKVKDKIRLFKPDVVHVHNLHFGASPSIIYAIKNSKVPVVLTLHNFRLICPSGTLFYQNKLFLNSLDQKFPWTAIKNGVYKNSKIITFWLAFSSYLHNIFGTWKKCDRIIVLTSHAKQLLLRSKLGLLEEKIVVKPNFCFEPKLDNINRSNNFLFIGRLSEEKGIMLLLAAFSENSYQLKIAGDGLLKDEVLSYSAKYSNIQFLGSLSKEEIFSNLQNCTALIFPSIWYEGMPLTIIEAFVCATPIIASRLGAMADMIHDGNNGLLFEPQHESDLQEKLKIWSDFSEEKKAHFCSNAKESYRRYYTPQKNIKQLLDVYHAVIV